MEMVEWVARAMCRGHILECVKAAELPEELEEESLQQEVDYRWRSWEPRAREAMESLRDADPTDAMLKAGESFCVSNGMAGCFYNMLGAALK